MTGVQTCALPISLPPLLVYPLWALYVRWRPVRLFGPLTLWPLLLAPVVQLIITLLVVALAPHGSQQVGLALGLELLPFLTLCTVLGLSVQRHLLLARVKKQYGLHGEALVAAL